MSNVVRLNVVTTLDLQPDDVLGKAVGQYPGGVFVAGYDADGNVQFSSSLVDGGEILWLMEVAKARLMKIAGELGDAE